MDQGKRRRICAAWFDIWVRAGYYFWDVNVDISNSAFGTISDPTDGEGLRLLNHLRSFDRTTELVPIATERHARDMAGEKTRLNITAFLHTPIQPAEFFRLVGRLRARKLSANDWGPPQVVEVRTTRSERVTLEVPKAK